MAMAEDVEALTGDADLGPRIERFHHPHRPRFDGARVGIAHVVEVDERDVDHRGERGGEAVEELRRHDLHFADVALIAPVLGAGVRRGAIWIADLVGGLLPLPIIALSLAPADPAQRPQRPGHTVHDEGQPVHHAASSTVSHRSRSKLRERDQRQPVVSRACSQRPRAARPSRCCGFVLFKPRRRCCR
jgi:hypothetical protein